MGLARIRVRPDKYGEKKWYPLDTVLYPHVQLARMHNSLALQAPRVHAPAPSESAYAASLAGRGQRNMAFGMRSSGVPAGSGSATTGCIGGSRIHLARRPLVAS